MEHLVKRKADISFASSTRRQAKIGNKGGFIRAEFETSINKRESDDFLNSIAEIFGTDAETIVRDQFTCVNDLGGIIA